MAKRKTIKKKERQRMAQVVTDRLEDSRRYNIVESDEGHILLAQKPEVFEDPSEIYVVLHNRKMPLAEYKKLVGENRSNGRYVSNIFYKDGINFLVRLAVRGKIKDDKSLKRYRHEERSNMVHLRDLEKAVLEGRFDNDSLVYFQPQTPRLEEGIRGYDMKVVELDYSHVGPGHPAYGRVRNGPAKDYRITDEIFYLKHGGIQFMSAGSGMLVVTPQETGQTK